MRVCGGWTARCRFSTTPFGSVATSWSRPRGIVLRPSLVVPLSGLNLCIRFGKTEQVRQNLEIMTLGDRPHFPRQFREIAGGSLLIAFIYIMVNFFVDIYLVDHH